MKTPPETITELLDNGFFPEKTFLNGRCVEYRKDNEVFYHYISTFGDGFVKDIPPTEEELTITNGWKLLKDLTKTKCRVYKNLKNKEQGLLYAFYGGERKVIITRQPSIH